MNCTFVLRAVSTARALKNFARRSGLSEIMLTERHDVNHMIRLKSQCLSNGEYGLLHELNACWVRATSMSRCRICGGLWMRSHVNSLTNRKNRFNAAHQAVQIVFRDAQQRVFIDCKWHSHVLSLSISSAQSDPSSTHSSPSGSKKRLR